MLYSLKKETAHERPKEKSTNKNKTYEITPTPCPPPIPWYEPTNHPTTYPIIHNNNTMDTEFLGTNETINKCGSVRNDEMFNLHLGSGVGPWVSITSHINDIVAIAIKLRYVHDNVCSYISGTWVENPQIHLKKSFLII